MKTLSAIQKTSPRILQDIVLVLSATVPTLLMVEFLRPGFVSQLVDITSLIVASIVLGIIYIATARASNRLSAFQRWYLLFFGLLDVGLLIYAFSLQKQHLLLGLAVAISVCVTFFVSIFNAYDRGGNN